MIDVFAGILGFLWALFVVTICWVLVRPWLILWFLVAIAVAVGIFVAVKMMRNGNKEGEPGSPGQEVEMS